MADKLNIAVLGASSLVGKAVLELLEQREFPLAELHCLEKDDSSEETLLFRNRNIEIEGWQDFDFACVDIALFADVDVSEVELTVNAGKAGAVVITDQAVFRHAQGIPLVVAGINDEAIADYSQHNIIASPHASTVHVLKALKGVYERVGISQLNLVNCQAVSAAGDAGIAELAGQTAKLLNMQSFESKVYAKQIAFNLLPGLGEMLDSGYSREEYEIATGIQKVLADHALEVDPAILQVPVFYGDTLDIILTPQQAIGLEELSALIDAQEGVTVLKDELPTPVTDAAESEQISVGRIRQLMSQNYAYRLNLVADNVRAGRALNMVKIAEILQQGYLD